MPSLCLRYAFALSSLKKEEQDKVEVEDEKGQESPRYRFGANSALIRRQFAQKATNK